jgi:alanine racemase
MSHVLAKLDRQALRHNLSVVRQHCPQQKIWAMVKADGYGHGLQWVVDVLADVDAFGVATLEEALQVKTDKPLFVMRGFLDADELAQMIEQRMGAVLHCWEQVELLRLNCHPGRPKAYPGSRPRVNARSDKSLVLWIKIDTGMHRLGFAPEDVPKLQQALADLPVNVVGWMTHLAEADEIDSPMTQQQLDAFRACVPAGAVTSVANSAGILAHSGTHRDWVRPGLMLYGASPFADKTAAELNLKPVMTVEAPVLAVKDLQAGMGVGYGQTWQAPSATRIAIIGMGYGDGYPREAAGASVVIAGKSYPVVGRVSMDMLAIDIGEQPIAIGATACIWGANDPVEKLAAAGGTIPYTLLTRISKRVELKEVGNE